MATNAAVADHQVPVTNGVEPPSPPPPHRYDTDELSLVQFVRFFLRHWRLIAGMALAAGFTAAFYMALSVPRTYEASATLVIVSPQFSSEFKPPTLTVQGYQKLLESDAVLAETKQRLLQQSVLAAGDGLQLGGNVETRIFISQKSDTTSLAPMLQTVVRGKTSAQAAAIANIWAQVFLERTHELMAGTTSAAVQFIDEQYPQARADVARLENEKTTTANEFQKRYDEAATRWDEKSLAFKGETADLISAYKAQTQQVLADFLSNHGMDTRKSEQEARRKAYSDLQGEQARVNSSLQYEQLELEVTRQQLAETPPYLTLQKAMTDDALWQMLAKGGDSRGKDVDWKSLQGRSLLTQEINPVYSELNSRKAQIEREVSAKVPRSTQLAQELERLSVVLRSLDTSVRADEAALEKLELERGAGLGKLSAERDARLDILMRQRQQELDAITRERANRLAQLGRDIGRLQGLYSELAKNYNQATLAKAQQEVEDVRLGAAAVPPDYPAPRGLATKSLLALIIGGIVGLFAAVIRDVAAAARSET
jgi:capsular polysaccharide biosynthesis protein